jgi:hypothetical protein
MLIKALAFFYSPARRQKERMMTDPTPTPQAGADPAQPPGGTDANTAPALVTPAPPAAADTDLESMDKLPKWAQKLYEDLRKENAKHRTEKLAADKANEEAVRKAAEEQGKFKELYELEMSKTQAAEARAKAAELASIKARIGAKLNLPAELLDRLRGETEEDIEADAKTLLAVIPKPAAITANDAGQGIGGSAPALQKSDEEIREMAARYGVSFEALKQQLVKT